VPISRIIREKRLRDARFRAARHVPEFLKNSRLSSQTPKMSAIMPAPVDDN
jgi:hypothetical protein